MRFQSALRLIGVPVSVVVWFAVQVAGVPPLLPGQLQLQPVEVVVTVTAAAGEHRLVVRAVVKVRFWEAPHWPLTGFGTVPVPVRLV
jgi:hypothetical protein